ncbi:MAG: response regulator [Anaerolineae bacterium]|nr:response regulator [Anaerolineae bacterium]
MVKVLVIEDEAPLLENILDILTFEDFEAIGAADGEEGVRLARECLPDLILCDIMMPKLDGYGVLLELRNDSTTSMIPLIFLTAKADRPSMRRGMELGADDYLPKPFTNVELVAAIESRLDRHTALVEKYKQQVDAMRHVIVYTLPHEFRTPLTGIWTAAQWLAEEFDHLERDAVLQLLQTIVKSGERLHRLIENYLLYAQIELVGLNLDKLTALRAFEVQEPIALIRQVAAGQAETLERGADLVCETGGAEVGAKVFKDSLKKIVTELVDNACKFSKAGTPIQIKVTTDDRVLSFCITDHGRGMTPEQIARVGAYVQFERKLYEQQGIGLGLIIAKRLAELHNGALTIQSVPGRQTTVCVTLPLM